MSRVIKCFVLAGFSFFLGQSLLLAQPGFFDSRFRPELNGLVNDLSIQPDGQILIAGEFTEVGGQPRPYLARLNHDGSLDSSFSASSLITHPVWKVHYNTNLNAIQVIVGMGPFHDRLRHYLLDVDGSPATNWVPCQPCEYRVDHDAYHSPGIIRAADITPFGMVWFGGSFSLIFDGTNRIEQPMMGRLDSRGRYLRHGFEFDTPTSSFPERWVEIIVSQGNNTTLIGGTGLSARGHVPNNVAYSIFTISDFLPIFPQSGFRSNIPGWPVAFAALPNGQRLVGISAANGIFRANNDFSLDESFQFSPMLDFFAPSFLAVYPDRTLYVQVALSICCPHPSMRIHIDETGAWRENFNPKYLKILEYEKETAWYANGYTNHVNGMSQPFLARILADHPGGQLTIARQGDADIQITLTGEPNQTYVLQVSEDGIRWSPIDTNASPDGQVEFVQPLTNEGKVRFYRSKLLIP